MDALTHEMESFRLPLAIDLLKIDYPLEKELVCGTYLILGDRVLEENPDGSDEHTEMGVI